MVFYLVLELVIGLFFLIGFKCLISYLGGRGVGGNVKLNCLNFYFFICRYFFGFREYKYWKGNEFGRNKDWGDFDLGFDRGYGDCFNSGLREYVRSFCGFRYFVCYFSFLFEVYSRL